MSTKGGTIGVAGRPTGIVVWTGIVSALAAAALVMSAVALIEARDDGSVAGPAGGRTLGVTSSYPALWDAGKLEAMKGRVLAESVGNQSYVLWDTEKLEAMEGRVLAESVGSPGYMLWDADKLRAMAGRVLAGTEVDNQDYVLWDEAKLEAMAGRVQAES